MIDIVVKMGDGIVKTRIDVLGDAQAVTSSALWLQDGQQPDHFKQFRQVKKADDAEGAMYVVGDESDLDNKLLEWVWTATRAPGSNAASATVRITVQQGEQNVEGYPLSKSFNFDADGPVTFALTRNIRVAP